MYFYVTVKIKSQWMVLKVEKNKQMNKEHIILQRYQNN